MTKTDLIAQVAANTEMSKKSAEMAVNAAFEALGKAMAEGEKISISGFGTFEVRERAERQGINPRTREPITIAASKSIVCEFHRKKVEMIMQAETKGEITEILKLSKPHFDGKKFVYTSPYAVEEEELLLWSLTSLQGPLRDEGYRRYRELFEKCLPEMAEKIPA